MSAPFFDPESGRAMSEAEGRRNARSSEMPRVMSLEEARVLLARVNKVTVAADDPLLCLVTLFGAFTGDLDKALERHASRVDRLLKATGEAYASGVEGMLDGLRDKTVRASIDNALALSERQAVAMDRFRRSLRRHTIVTGVLTFVASVTALLALAVLFHTVK